MRVLHLITATQRRGAELFAVALDERLRARHESTVVALSASDGASPLDVEVLDAARPTPRALARLRRRMAAADITIAHGSRTLLMSALAGAPFVYRSIGDPDAWSARSDRRARVGFALRRAACVVALWGDAATRLQALHRLDAERLAVIPNAADGRWFRPATSAERHAARQALGVPSSDPVVVFIGALSEEKRVDTAIDAVATMDSTRLLIVGEGPERSSLEDRARGTHGRVSFIGSVADPVLVLHAADAVVLPSRTEGMPAVLIEAGLCGLPAVASAVGGVPAVIADGMTGVLVPPNDAEALADGLTRAIDQGPSLGAAARQRCSERFELDAVAAQWEELLLSCVHGR